VSSGSTGMVMVSPLRLAFGDTRCTWTSATTRWEPPRILASAQAREDGRADQARMESPPLADRYALTDRSRALLPCLAGCGRSQRFVLFAAAGSAGVAASLGGGATGSAPPLELGAGVGASSEIALACQGPIRLWMMARV